MKSSSPKVTVCSSPHSPWGIEPQYIKPRMPGRPSIFPSQREKVHRRQHGVCRRRRRRLMPETFSLATDSPLGPRTVPARAWSWPPPASFHRACSSAADGGAVHRQSPLPGGMCIRSLSFVSHRCRMACASAPGAPSSVTAAGGHVRSCRRRRCDVCAFLGLLAVELSSAPAA